MAGIEQNSFACRKSHSSKYWVVMYIYIYKVNNVWSCLGRKSYNAYSGNLRCVEDGFLGIQIGWNNLLVRMSW